MSICGRSHAEYINITDVTATASDTRSIKKAILQSISFLNKNANGVSMMTVTSPTNVGVTKNIHNSGIVKDTHINISDAMLRISVAMASIKVITGTIFFIF